MENNLKMEANNSKWHDHHMATMDKQNYNPPHPQASLTRTWHPTSMAQQWKTTPAMNKEAMTRLDITKGKQPRQHNQWRQYIREKQKVKPKLANNTFTWHPRHKSKDNLKDSHRSIKWQPQE
jgi:hypothetical protein